MADRIAGYKVNCIGGLDTNRDLLSQPEISPGTATQLINYEPSLSGGYRRISGFANSYGTVPGSGNVLGVAVSEGINDGIFAARAPSFGNTEYFYKWDNATEDWIAITTPVSISMSSVKKVRFVEYNWGSPEMAIADGINPAAIYDGTTYTQITHANAPNSPKYLDVFKNHLFLAGDTTDPYNLYFSSPFTPTDFNPANGAGVINVGFDVVQIKQFRDALFIFGKNKIKRLSGTSVADFVITEITNNLGCLAPDSVIELAGNLIFLSPDGFRPIAGTDRIGDVELQTISKAIQFTTNAIISDIAVGQVDIDTVTSVVVRTKSQFRFFIPENGVFGLLGGIRQTPQGFNFEYSQLFGIPASCADSGFLGTEEYVIHGDSTGKVYRQESGISFDGENILSVYQTPFYYFEDPTVRKNFYNISTFLRSEGTSSIAFSVIYDFDDTVGVFNPANYSISIQGSAAYYNEAIYDAIAVYDGNPSPVEKTNIAGSGFSVAFKYVTEDTNASHTIQGFVLNYGVNDRR